MEEQWLPEWSGRLLHFRSYEPLISTENVGTPRPVRPVPNEPPPRARQILPNWG
jgi:hypothetical protein